MLRDVGKSDIPFKLSNFLHENRNFGFQGAVIEHQRHIEQLGQEAVVVRYTEQLAEIDGIILPGGESTTMGNY